VNLLLTMLLGGLWHGAGWTFVAWGALHGLYLSVYHGWTAWRKRGGRELSQPSPAGVWAGRLLTFLLVLLAWVFFRAESFAGAMKLIGSMAGLHGFSLHGLPINIEKAAKWVVPFLVVVWFFPNSHEIAAAYKPALEYERDNKVQLAPTPRRLGALLTWRPNLIWVLVLAVLMVWAVLNLSQPSEFIYWQF
jgi:hypothetical protein